MQEPRRRLVTTGPAGRSFAVVRLDAGGYGVEDHDQKRLIGELHGAITALQLRISADVHVIFAGERDSDRTDHVEIRLPYGLQTCRVKNDVWMSFPEPYVPNVIVTATWRDANGNALWHWESPPLRQGGLQSYHGPGWTSYAPLDE